MHQAQAPSAMHPIGKFFAAIPTLIEKAVRSIDAWWAGTSTVPWFRERSLMAFFLPLPVYVFILGGPALLSWSDGPAWRGGLATAGVMACIIVLQLWYFHQRTRRHWMAWMHFATVTVLAIATFYLAEPDAKEASDDIYRHYYGWAALILLFIAVPFDWLLHKCKVFKLSEPVLAGFRSACDPAAIVAAHPPRPLRFLDVFSAFVVSILQTPLHVITPVAFFVVLAPTTLVTWWMVAFVTLLSWGVFAASNYDPRQNSFVRYVRRNFLTGGSLFVTLVVIAFGVLRFAKVDYVTTVLDAEVKSTVLSYICSTYAALWLYDFWVNQATIDLLGDLRHFTTHKGKLLRHGSGRIMVVGPDDTVRLMLGPNAFLWRIAEIAPEDQRNQLREDANRLEQHMRGYYLACSCILVVAIGLVGWWLHKQQQAPGLLVPSVTQTQQATFDLAGRLKERGMVPGAKPVIMLAASGGGTRAAIYTAAVLHGLARAGKLDQLIVGSGVSGGSAALAYYAAHGPAMQTDPDWIRMQDCLSCAFIDEVLAGFGEWRIVTGSRLESLLSESFLRHLAPANKPVPLASITNLGLIFNTSICGVEENAVASKDQAGGRLVITNLLSRFCTLGKTPDPSLEMPYHIVWAPEASVFAAAALSANFPPVFSNAAVDTEGTVLKRYWVTDGGAVENRGEVSILLALVDTLTQLRGSDPTPPRIILPPITVIAADASAFDPAYASDRGVGAKLAASDQLTKLLVRELHGRVARMHAELTGSPDQVRFIELAMPDALRVSGAFGTHWMMPGSMLFRDQPARDGTADDIVLSKATALGLIDALFHPSFGPGYIASQFTELRPQDAKRIFDACQVFRTRWASIP